MGRGLSGIIFIWCRGYFLNRKTWKVCLEKGHKRGRVLKGIEGRAGGSAQKCLLPPLSTGKQRRGRRGGGAWLAAFRFRRRSGRGGKGRGGRGGIDSPPHLERGWGVAAWPLWCMPAGGDGRGSSVARRGRGLAAADELEEVEGVLPLPSPQAERQRGVLATAASGGCHWRAWRRRYGAEQGRWRQWASSWRGGGAVEAYL